MAKPSTFPTVAPGNSANTPSISTHTEEASGNGDEVTVLEVVAVEITDVEVVSAILELCVVDNAVLVLCEVDEVELALLEEVVDVDVVGENTSEGHV